MNSDTRSFVAAMAARGLVRFAAPVAEAAAPKKSRVEAERERKFRLRRAQGRRVYAQPFRGKLPPSSDPSYGKVYARLQREARGCRRVKRHPELAGLPEKEWRRLWTQKKRAEKGNKV